MGDTWLGEVGNCTKGEGASEGQSRQSLIFICLPFFNSHGVVIIVLLCLSRLFWLYVLSLCCLKMLLSKEMHLGLDLVSGGVIIVVKTPL